ncbi:MAG: 1-deoxy-D-xylulose-5-phosphate reductoisomerase [Epsilonproteobacteria bacterium]|nr:1-deoxy-D-xylulose-5-phosphate reductoisomerase [Campylobacterota bacterium]
MIILGSTGSIGTAALEVAKKHSLNIEALVAGENYELLNTQIKEFKPKYVAVKDKQTAQKVNFKNVKYGEEAILEIIQKAKSRLLLNALVGEAGLKPTLQAQKCGKEIALANKESLVIAGKFINTQNIFPVDSEHFGLWYLLNGKWKMENGKYKRENENLSKIKKLYITASGGALRDWSAEDIKNATLKDVLNHPNWSMGKKITIDSATMANKLFEILEAKWLFNTDNIDAVIEPKSIIHALVEYKDGSTTAHLSKADMKLPITYALLNDVKEPVLEPVNLLEIGMLEFKKISTKRYPLWSIKDELLKNSDLGVVVNTANEYAIGLFLKNEISFYEISKIILSAFEKFDDIELNNIDDIFIIRDEVLKWCKNFKV